MVPSSRCATRMSTCGRATLMVEAEAALRAAARIGQPGAVSDRGSDPVSSRAELHHRRAPARSARAALQCVGPVRADHRRAGGACCRGSRKNGEADAALSQLEAITHAEAYQPLWAARARILWLSGQETAAHEAASRAAGLSSDPGIRRFLLAGRVSGWARQ